VIVMFAASAVNVKIKVSEKSALLSKHGI
jgi:hypothetical protein